MQTKTAGILTEIPVATYSFERFRDLLGDDGFREVEEAVDRARILFEGRVLWHVNSTARGGGVVELLTSLLAYTRGAGGDPPREGKNPNPEVMRRSQQKNKKQHRGWGDAGGEQPPPPAHNQETHPPRPHGRRRRVQPGDLG